MTLPGQVIDSASLAQQVLARIPRDPARARIGQVTGIDPAGVATVNVDGADLTAALLLTTPVTVGDNVMLLRHAGTLYVLGPVTPSAVPSEGIVASVPVDSYSIVLTTAVGTITAGFVAAYTPTVGDVVLLSWHGSQAVVVGKKGLTGTPPAPVPAARPATPRPAPAVSSTRSTTFAASSCGTHRPEGWVPLSVSGGNVIQGDYGYGLNDGAWFYGGRIRASLAGATVTGAQIWLGRASGGLYAAQAAHLYRVTNNTQPPGDVTFTATTFDVAVAVGQTGWFTLPNSFVQDLVDSGGSVGVQAPSGAYMRLWGLAQSGQAGSLKISWSR